MTTDEQILICAVRYALGRRSYMVNVVTQYVTFKRKTLSKECINIIIRDIQEELERYHALGSTLGDACDERDWVELLGLLRGNEDAE